jgi:hypothetical protein
MTQEKIIEVAKYFVAQGYVVTDLSHIEEGCITLQIDSHISEEVEEGCEHIVSIGPGIITSSYRYIGHDDQEARISGNTTPEELYRWAQSNTQNI